MLTAAITDRPLYAFGAALVGCGVYFLVLFGALTALRATLTPGLYFTLIALPVLISGFFHYTVTRNAAMSQWRRWLQIVTSAVGAPLIAWYLVGFGLILATGEGF